MRAEVRSLKNALIAALLLMALSSCISDASEGLLTNTPEGSVPTSSSTPALSPRPTLFPTASSTVAPPTAQPSATTPLPTPTSLQTTMTVAPSPATTLSADEAQTRVLALLKDNGGCRLPCWWGTTPGSTKWQEVESLLQPLSRKIYSARGAHEVWIPAPYQPPSAWPLRLIYRTNDSLITKIDVELTSEFSFGLSEILSAYGVPSEVWLSTYAQAREDLPFHILLVYFEEGFAIEYGAAATEAEDVVVGCPLQDERQTPFLFLWEPGDISTTEGVLRESSLYDAEQRYLPLSEATSVNVEDFYEAFRRGDNSQCLETPMEIWRD